MRRRVWLLAVLVSLLGALAGCGGVDSGGTGTGAAPQTLAVGPITGFGSIIVNGVRYDDGMAMITDDDGRSIESSQLKLGMQAVVQASAIVSSGTVSTATASRIAVRSDIVGPIEAINRTAGTLTVLGQTVAVVPATVFDAGLPMGVASLSTNDVVEVFGGYDAAASRYVASRITLRSGVSAYKLRGPVAALSLPARTLTIGTAVVDWSAVAPVDPASALAPGRTIRVTVATAPTAAGWRATALSTGKPVLEDRDRVEIEGRISAFTSVTQFEVNGFAVDASAVPPADTAGLALGVKIEVTGSARGGVLLAQKVGREDDEGGNLELHGSIESVDSVASRFIVRGVTVRWSATTSFEGGSAADILPNRQVEVRGGLSDDGTLLDATSIHIER
jgi:hypothetical protein